MREIRTFRPDAVLAVDPETLFYDDEGVNHTDHRAAGFAAVDAVYPAARNGMAFPWLARDGLEPHIVRRLYLFWSGRPTAWIDVSGTIDRKLEALRAHPSQLRHPEELEPRIRGWAKEEGHAIGVEAAEALRVIVIEADPEADARVPGSGGCRRRLITRPGGRRAGRRSVGLEEGRAHAAPVVPDLREVAGARPERVDHLAQRQVAGVLDQPLVGRHGGLLVQLGELPLARPVADPHPVEARVAHRERQVALGGDPLVGEPADAVVAIAERRQRGDDLARLAWP